MLRVYQTIAVVLGTLSSLHAASTGDCGSRSLNATSNRQFIQSPGYPAGYGSNEDCRWTITVSTPNMMVRIEVIDSDIGSYDETYVTCVPAGVRAYNGPTTIFDPKILTWCGPSLPTFQSSGSTITLFFYTEKSSLKGGFKLAYYETKERYHCGGTLNITTTDYTTITSPNYPGPYQNRHDCTWTIHAPANTNIEAKIRNTAIETESSSQCTFGFLEIYDGVRTSSSSAGKFCGDDDTDYISSGNIITVRFFSDGIFSTHKGFQMQLKAGSFSASETKDLTASWRRMYIHSPNYPFNYPSNADFGWKITADKDHLIKIDAIEFELERSDSCASDYLEAFDGPDSNAPSLGRWCGESEHNTTSSGAVLFLRFKTDSSGVDRGFKIKYTTKLVYNNHSPDSDIPIGAIVGVAIGGAALLLLISGVIGMRIYKQGRRNKATNIPVQYTTGQLPVTNNFGQAEITNTMPPTFTGPPSYTLAPKGAAIPSSGYVSGETLPNKI